ncbi:hypothetical protein CLOM_g21303 [Closterium sp. NIES-68]|nr:hypothetical protein CLOM_g21303 [Closterium sp. NIES-68]GJP82884.1 hypothetical protein CLOP_g13110 [Closterium sp. NIES-67]
MAAVVVACPTAACSLSAASAGRKAAPRNTAHLAALPVFRAARSTAQRRGGFLKVSCSSSSKPEAAVVESAENAVEQEPSFVASGFLEKAMLMSAVAMTPLLLGAQDALAVDGDFGLLEGRTAALVHPLVMGGLFFTTLYAFYLGRQWKQVRVVGDKIQDLKKQLPAGDDAAASPLSGEIATLTAQRTELVKGNYREKHFNVGSLLLGFGVLIAVEGCVNTWFRTGKLFPGPHLWAGATITVLWALAASLVPAMQKGNPVARKAHVALNMLNLALFAWQIPTGLEIVGKVFEFTSWP